MRLLLDTHIALWAIVDDPRLTAPARALIGDSANSVAVSIASLWEIAIKHALARKRPQRMPLSAAEALSYFDGAGYEILPIAAAHIRMLESLKPLHGDPFDRMLVAQALSEPMRLLTHDPKIAAYSDSFVVV